MMSRQFALETCSCSLFMAHPATGRQQPSLIRELWLMLAIWSRLVAAFAVVIGIWYHDWIEIASGGLASLILWRVYELTAHERTNPHEEKAA